MRGNLIKVGELGMGEFSVGELACSEGIWGGVNCSEGDLTGRTWSEVNRGSEWGATCRLSVIISLLFRLSVKVFDLCRL